MSPHTQEDEAEQQQIRQAKILALPLFRREKLVPSRDVLLRRLIDAIVAKGDGGEAGAPPKLEHARDLAARQVDVAMRAERMKLGLPEKVNKSYLRRLHREEAAYHRSEEDRARIEAAAAAPSRVLQAADVSRLVLEMSVLRTDTERKWQEERDKREELLRKRPDVNEDVRARLYEECQAELLEELKKKDAVLLPPEEFTARVLERVERKMEGLKHVVKDVHAQARLVGHKPVLSQAERKKRNKKKKKNKKGEEEEEEEEEKEETPAQLSLADEAARANARKSAEQTDAFKEKRRQEQAQESANLTTLKGHFLQDRRMIQDARQRLQSKWMRSPASTADHEQRRQQRIAFFADVLRFRSVDWHNVVGYNTEHGCADPRDPSRKLSEPGTRCVLLVRFPQETHFEVFNFLPMLAMATWLAVPVPELERFLHGKHTLACLNDYFPDTSKAAPEIQRALTLVRQSEDIHKSFVSLLCVDHTALCPPEVQMPSLRFDVTTHKALELPRFAVRDLPDERPFLTRILCDSRPTPLSVCHSRECLSVCWPQVAGRDLLACQHCPGHTFCRPACKRQHYASEHAGEKLPADLLKGVRKQQAKENDKQLMREVLVHSTGSNGPVVPKERVLTPEQEQKRAERRRRAGMPMYMGAFYEMQDGQGTVFSPLLRRAPCIEDDTDAWKWSMFGSVDKEWMFGDGAVVGTEAQIHHAFHKLDEAHVFFTSACGSVALNSATVLHGLARWEAASPKFKGWIQEMRERRALAGDDDEHARAIHIHGVPYTSKSDLAAALNLVLHPSGSLTVRQAIVLNWLGCTQTLAACLIDSLKAATESEEEKEDREEEELDSDDEELPELEEIKDTAA